MREIRWGVLGCAGIARSAFIPALRQTRQGRLFGIASRDLARAQAWQQEFGFARAYSSYEALLQDPEIDAVYIPLPNALHAPWVERAAACGKHIFCEKPLAVTAAEATRMVEACRAAGVQLLEAFVYRLHPQTQRLLALLEEGRIGTLRSVETSFHFVLRERVANIRMSRELAGGALMDVGCYTISLARLLLGEPEAVAASAVLDPQRGVDTSLSALLRFASGRTALISASMDMAGGQRATLYGDQGEIVLSQPFHPRAGAQLVVRAGGREEVIETGLEVHPFAPALEHFQTCLAEGRPVALPPLDSVRNTQVLEAVRRAAASGRWERVG